MPLPFSHLIRETSMTSIRRSASILILSLTAAVAGHAMAQETSTLTRAQVQADFQKARANGDLMEGESGLRQNQLRPDLYPAQTAQGQALSSEQVNADMQKARAAGQLQYGETY